MKTWKMLNLSFGGSSAYLRMAIRMKVCSQVSGRGKVLLRLLLFHFLQVG
jgi:hypothetical protein